METGRVVITGAGRGLGRALAERYLAEGSDVWAGCRNPAQAADLAGAGAHVRQLDVSDERPITRFGAEVAGDGDVAVLVNNAGTDARAFGSPAGRRGPFDIDAEHFLAEMRVNAAGPMLLTRALREPLIAGQPGKVVNISSRLASMVIGGALCWDIGYNASKAALTLSRCVPPTSWLRPALWSSPSTPDRSAPAWAARKPIWPPKTQPASWSGPLTHFGPSSPARSSAATEQATHGDPPQVTAQQMGRVTAGRRSASGSLALWSRWRRCL